MSRVVVVHRPGLRYVDAAPYDAPNPVYEAVEAMFKGLGLDRARAGTPEWNPLGDLIAPGIARHRQAQPRLVQEHAREDHGLKLAASSTHGSLLRPILDYALRAAGPRGRVRVVDTPVEGCEIEKVAGPLGIFAAIRHLQARGHDVDFVDMRYFRVAPHLALDDVRRGGRSWNLGLLLRRRLPGDPRGYRTVDLAEQSRFAEPGAPAGRDLRFHRSHYQTPVAHHTGGRHEYSAPGTVLDADVVINLPKLKTHKKTAVTLSLKSVIGLTNEKYWLPHFTAGDPSIGGDEYDRQQALADRVENKLSRLPLPGDNSLIARAPRVGGPPKVIDGSWEGNQTLWRTILDLNRILFFADREGKIRDTPAAPLPDHRRRHRRRRGRGPARRDPGGGRPPDRRLRSGAGRRGRRARDGLRPRAHRDDPRGARRQAARRRAPRRAGDRARRAGAGARVQGAAELAEPGLVVSSPPCPPS